MSYKTHFRPAGRGKTACGRRAKTTELDTGDYRKVTCSSCQRTVSAWRRWLKDTLGVDLFGQAKGLIQR